MSQVSLLLVSFALVAKLLSLAMAQQPSTVPLLNTAFPSESSTSTTNVAPVIRIRQPAAPPTLTRRTGPQPTSYSPSNLDGEETVNYPREPYNFGYDVRDEFGNHQYRKEEADASGVVRGTYGYTDSNGLFRYVDYVADSAGYRANIRSNEPGMTGAQAANVVLSAEEPPKSIFNTPSVNQFPRRRIGLELESSARSAEIHHIASSSDSVTSTERAATTAGGNRYSFPLPGRHRSDDIEVTTLPVDGHNNNNNNHIHHAANPSASPPPTASPGATSRISYATRIAHIANPK